MQDTESSTFGSGKGYSLKRTNAGTLSFTGTYPGGPINPTISKNLSTWNLIGNQYPSYINISRFIAENTIANNNLATAFTAIYVWDPTSGVTGEYIDLTTGYIHPGQAFFVYDNVNGTASITETMQSHEPDTFYKTSNTTIHLILSNGTSSKKAKINYLNGKTTGLDAGFDIGMFDGVNSVIKIYTHLIENNEGIAFARQALPNSDLETLVVPIGVEATINTELTFSAEALNIPVNIKVFLEDRLTNTFTRLDEDNANYKVTLTETLNGIGRFYLHTKSSTLDTNFIYLKNISLYKTSNSNLRIVGLSQGKSTIKLTNMLGKQVLNTSFTANGVQNISLPKLAHGIYVVQLESENGKSNKKIILE